MPNEAAIAELTSDSREWANPDWARLSEAVHRLLIPFVAPDFYFNGDVSLEGSAKIVRRYDNVEKWVDALKAGITSANCHVSTKKDRRVALWANYSESRVDLRINVPEGEIAEAQELLTQLRSALGLRDREQSDESAANLERRFFVEKPKDSAWCLNAFELLVPAASSKDRRSFDGRIVFGTPAGFRQSFRSRQAWLTAVTTEWGGLIALDCSDRDGSKSNRIVWDLQSSDFRVNLERRTAREVFTDFEAFEAKLGLQSTGSGYTRHPLQGGEARYFAPRETDSSWFYKQVVPAILSVTAGDFYIDLTARTGVHGRNTHSWQVIDRWRQFVIENWAEIVDLRAYLSGPGLTLTFNYDNFRERATLDIRTPTKEASDKLVAQFVSQLGLESLGDAQHWQFRTTALYSVSIITNEVFASEVRKLVHLLFPGKYLLNQARVLEPLNEKQGEEEKQTIVQFTALDEFLTRLGSDKAYSEAILQLEGPRGKNLYVGLTNKLTKLEIRSSERPGDFSQILKNLESRLSLTVVSVTPSGTDKRPLKESAWVLIAIPVATAFATGTIFSDTFRTWITAKPKLEITSPPKSSGSPPAPATVSETFEVRWQVQTESFGKKQHIEQSNATFHINKDGTDVVTKVCVPSGGTIKLDRPGKYHIRINSCDYGGEGDRTEFEVK